MTLLQMSISGAALIAVASLLRLMLRRAVPKRAFVSLWLVVLARLLVPFAPVIEAPLPALFPAAAEQRVAETAPPTAEPSAPVTTVNSPAPSVDQSPVVPANAWNVTVPPARAAVPVRTVVYWSGALAVGTAFALLYLRHYRRFRRAVPVSGEAAESWLAAHPLRRALTVKTLPGVASPLTYGVLRPVILVPGSFDFADEAARFALEHEYVHARRLDAAFKLLLAAAAAVHWFNPAVWLMVWLANRDVELSCDEAVLERFGASARGSYARALLSMAEARGASPALCAPFGASPITERIHSIMKYKKKSALSLLLAAALTLALAACAATTVTEQTDVPGGDGEAPAPNTEETVVPIETTADTVVENGGLQLVIPGDYADLLLVETPQNGAWGTLFSVSEKASVEAAKADGHEDWGMGGLFGISRITKAQLDELMTADMSGAEIFARDEQGCYYEFSHATDVRFYRSGDDYQNDTAGWAQWEELNDWAWNGVRASFLANNPGLTAFAVSNTALDIFLARLSCWGNVRCTLGSTVYGELEPAGVDPAPYVARLRDGVTFVGADLSETPDGEYFVLNFPDDGERFDFFIADGRYVREVYDTGYQSLYRAEGIADMSAILREWYNAAAQANGLAPLSALNATMNTVIEARAARENQDRKAALLLRAQETAKNYYEQTAYVPEEMTPVRLSDNEIVFAVKVSQDGAAQANRTITLWQTAFGVWTVVDEKPFLNAQTGLIAELIAVVRSTQ